MIFEEKNIRLVTIIGLVCKPDLFNLPSYEAKLLYLAGAKCYFNSSPNLSYRKDSRTKLSSEVSSLMKIVRIDWRRLVPVFSKDPELSCDNHHLLNQI